MTVAQFYPIGTPGQPWGDAERAQWRARQQRQRSYHDDVVAALTLEEETVEGMYFRYCRPKAQPVSFPISDGALIEYTVKMCACFNMVKGE